MSDEPGRELSLPDEDWIRTWQRTAPADVDAEKVARAIMAQVWRFDHMLFWRNAREYAAGIALLVVFAAQLVLGYDRLGALLGIGSVGFVLSYLWWKHRGLHPLDPASDASAYKAALLARYDDQIRLLRSVTYWYLLPLLLPPVWVASRTWSTHPVVAAVSLLVVLALYAGLGWLNVVWGVRSLQEKRERIDALYPQG
jgi:hypothetical protein